MKFNDASNEVARDWIYHFICVYETIMLNRLFIDLLLYMDRFFFLLCMNLCTYVIEYYFLFFCDRWEIDFFKRAIVWR